MKKILYMLLCLFLLVGCTHQTGGNTGSSVISTDPVVTTTTPALNNQEPILLEGIYKNDNNTTSLIINSDNTYEKYCYPSDGEAVWASTGTIVHVVENIYRTYSNYSFNSLESGFHSLDIFGPTWFIVENNTLYQLEICQIMEYFDKQELTPYCWFCADCDPYIDKEEKYPIPSNEELLIYRDYYLETQPSFQMALTYFIEIYKPLKKEE